MILIADSGSTKTDWCVILNGTPIKRIGTKGLNPFFQSEEEIQQELTHSLLRNCQNATALAAATFKESTPHAIGIRTV